MTVTTMTATTMTAEQQATYVDAAAAVMGLDIAPFRDGVLRYFALAAEMNARLDAFPLGPHDESGAVFRWPGTIGSA